MLKHASVHDLAWLLSGLAMATAFWLLSGNAAGGWCLIALKGGSVAALSAYALTHSQHLGAIWIAAIMAAGAAGDVAIELNTVAGGGFFLLSHLIAIALYCRNPRARPARTQKVAAAALLAGVPIAAWLLTLDLLAVVYAVALAAMAASAWLSRFSRYRVGIGALLFVASDLLIFARLGGALPQSFTTWFVWPLYYAGQLLICTGVIHSARTVERS